MTFPIVNGSNLLREKLTLPQDFAGNYNLLFIAFQQWHQEEVNTWIPLAESYEAGSRVLFTTNYPPSAP